MAYDPYTAVHAIYQYKGDWEKAERSGDKEAAQKAAASAQPYYRQLRQNGYTQAADQLEKSNYTQAADINRYWAKTGKTAIRPYYQNLGKQYGLSPDQVDSMITYDETTGEVAFGGKNLGKPAAEADGVSYWDEDKLDKAWEEGVSRLGLTKAPEVMYNQQNTAGQEKLNQNWRNIQADRVDLRDKYNQLLDYQYDTNPYESEIGKSIMADYLFRGSNAAANETAAGAASNSGNIDSFAAANAARQQLAYTNAGKTAVLNDFNTRVVGLQTTLGNLGIQMQNDNADARANIEMTMNQAQQMFSNAETERNNQLSRDAAMAEVTGQVPERINLASNPYFKADGTLIDEEADYQAIINTSREKLNTSRDEQEKRNLQYTIEMANQARNYKILHNPAYRKYLDTMQFYAPTQTENARQFDKQIQSAENLSAGANQTQLLMQQNELGAQQDMQNAEFAFQKENMNR